MLIHTLVKFSSSGYQLNDTNCYSVRDLKRVVAKVNSLPKNQNIAFAILGRCYFFRTN